MRSSSPKPAASPPPPEEHVGYLLKRLQHSLRQAVDEALRTADVGWSFAHLVTLFGIHHHPGVSGAQIAKRAMVTAQTINTILHRLEKEGSVERRPHPANRRVDCWYITAAGLARMREARAAADPVWERMLAPFSDAEVTQLRNLLRRCIAGLERGGGADDNGEAAARLPAKPARQKKQSSRKSKGK